MVGTFQSCILTLNKENLLTENIQNIILPVEKTIPGSTKHFIIYIHCSHGRELHIARLDTVAFFVVVCKYSPTYIKFSTPILQKHLKNRMHEELIIFLPLLTQLICLVCAQRKISQKMQLKTLFLIIIYSTKISEIAAFLCNSKCSKVGEQIKMKN